MASQPSQLPPGIDIAKAQRLLAELHASNNLVVKTWTYPLPPKPQKSLKGEDIVKQAIAFFQVVKPDYSLANFLPRKLTRNVIQILQTAYDSAPTPAPETISIPNGCCTLEECPTKLFYECVLKAVVSL